MELLVEEKLCRSSWSAQRPLEIDAGGRSTASVSFVCDAARRIQPFTIKGETKSV